MQNSPYRNLWLVIPPVVPVLGALAILEFISLPNASLFSFIETISIQNQATLMGGLLTYTIVAYFHFFVCLGCITYCWVRIREVANLPKKPVYGAVYLMILLVVVTLIGLSQEIFPAPQTHIAAYQLTYFNFSALLCDETGLQGICNKTGLWGASKLALLVYIPAILGIIAVLFASGVAIVSVREIPEDDETTWRQIFSQRVHNLQECFYVLSAVLVTSTLSAAVFFHLSLDLIDHKDAAREVLRLYIRGLSIFWGGIYTLTLMAVFLAPALMLWYRARVYANRFHAVNSPKQFREWLSTQGLAFTANRHLGNFTALFAPLLTAMVSLVSQYAVV